MKIPPASVLAAWPKPNYVNPTTRGPTNLIVISTLLGFVTLILSIRIYTRIRISKGFGLDDVLIVLAYIPATAFAIAGIYGEYQLQLNRHAWDIEPAFITPELQLGMATQVLFDIATSLTKLSMLALIYRLAVAVGSRTRHLVRAMAFVVAAGSMVFVIVTIFQCSPVSAYWTLSLDSQKCIDEPTHLLAASIINTVEDLIIVLLPIRIVLLLQIPTKQRVVVYALFAGGLFASAAGAVRTYFTWVMTTAADHDASWNAYVVVLTSSLELYVGILVASMPAIKPFISTYIPKLLGNPSWTRVTEPLEERLKHSKNNSTSGFSFRDASRGGIASRGLHSSSIINNNNNNNNTKAGPNNMSHFSTMSLDSPAYHNNPLSPSTTTNLLSPVPQVLLSPTLSSSSLSPQPLKILSPRPIAPPNLNKPLPRIGTGAGTTAQDMRILSIDRIVSQRSQGSNIDSVYDFTAYADGHISVHKAGRRGSSR